MPWDELRFIICAREFGWSWDDFENVPIDMEPWVLPINAAISKANDDRQEKAQRAAEAKQKGRHRRN